MVCRALYSIKLDSNTIHVCLILTPYQLSHSWPICENLMMDSVHFYLYEWMWNIYKLLFSSDVNVKIPPAVISWSPIWYIYRVWMEKYLYVGILMRFRGILSYLGSFLGFGKSYWPTSHRHYNLILHIVYLDLSIFFIPFSSHFGTHFTGILVNLIHTSTCKKHNTNIQNLILHSKGK